MTIPRWVCAIFSRLVAPKKHPPQPYKLTPLKRYALQMMKQLLRKHRQQRHPPEREHLARISRRWMSNSPTVDKSTVSSL